MIKLSKITEKNIKNQSKITKKRIKEIKKDRYARIKKNKKNRNDLLKYIRKHEYIHTYESKYAKFGCATPTSIFRVKINYDKFLVLYINRYTSRIEILDSKDKAISYTYGICSDWKNNIKKML